MLVRDGEAACRLVSLLEKDKPRWVALDTESAGGDKVWAKKGPDGYPPDAHRHRLCGISLAWRPGMVLRRPSESLLEAPVAPGTLVRMGKVPAPPVEGLRKAYIAYEHADTGGGRGDPAESIRAVLRAIRDTGARVWAHNWQHDARVLDNFLGWYKPILEYFPSIGDTQVLAWLLDFGEHKYMANDREVMVTGLKDLVFRLLGHKMATYQETIGGRRVLVSGPSDVELESVMLSALADAEADQDGKKAPKTYTEAEAEGLPLGDKALHRFLSLTKSRQARVRKAYRALAKQQVWRSASMAELRVDEVADYAMDDAVQTHRIAELMWPFCVDGFRDNFDRVEMPTLRLIYAMESRGISIATDKIEETKARVMPLRDAVAREWSELTGGTSISSAVQARVVYTMGAWPEATAPRTNKGELSTGKDAVKAAKRVCDEGSVGYRLAELRERYMEYTVIAKTFPDQITAQLPYRADGRLRSDIRQTGTLTGRFSATNPNVQAQPKSDEIRGLYVAQPGYKLVVGDWSGLEAYIMAHFSCDALLTQILVDGLDIHTVNAERLGIERKVAKCVDSETLVWTESGPRRIGDVVRLSAAGFGECSGSLWSGKDYAPIVRGYRDDTTDALIVVSDRGVVTVSPTHRLATVDGLKEARHLREGDELLTPGLPVYPATTFVGDTFGFRATEDLAYVAGAYTGDGCAHPFRVSICFSGKEPLWGLRLARVCRAAGLYQGIKRNGGRCPLVILGGRDAQKKLQAMGLVGADRKRTLRVPGWVLTGAQPVRLAFLAGLVDTDGYVGARDGYASICTKSPELASDVLSLASLCGLNCKVSLSWNSTYERYYYILRFTAKSTQLVHQFMRHPKRSSVRFSAKPSPRHRVRNRVLKVLPRPGRVLLDVELATEDHMYVAGTLLGHNTVQYLKQYGGGAAKLAQTLGRDLVRKRARDGGELWVAPPDVQAYFDEYDRMYSGVTEFKRYMGEFALEHGYADTLFGRRRYLPDIRSNEKWKAARAHRQAVSARIQGSAADIAKEAGIRLAAMWRGQPKHLLMQVHDEWVAEVREDLAEEAQGEMTSVMETCVELTPPLKAKVLIGDSWADCKD